MKLLISILLTAFSYNVSAATPTFDNLSDSDFKTISKEFSALFIHTSATPPASLGKIFGVEAGIIGGVAQTPGIEEITKRFDPNTDIPYAPFATLYGALSVPFGITVETNLLPSVTVSGLDLQHYGLAAKWTVTDQFLQFLPFNLALKTYYSQSKLSFQQNVTTPIASTVDLDFENSMIGAETLIGWDLIVVEPYVGAGYASSHSKLSAVANLDPSYSVFVDSSSSKNNDVSSLRLIAGCEFNLTLLKLGLEYNHVFDTDRAAAKISFAF